MKKSLAYKWALYVNRFEHSQWEQWLLLTSAFIAAVVYFSFRQTSSSMRDLALILFIGAFTSFERRGFKELVEEAKIQTRSDQHLGQSA